MKLSRYLVLIMAVLLATLAVPAMAGAAPASKLVTYTAPNGEWSVQYPSDLLHVEKLNNDVTIFISKDRRTVAAIDTYDARVSLTGKLLLRRGQITLQNIYGKPVASSGVLDQPGARWQTGFGFTTSKGSKGAALYHQNGRSQGDYRIFGFAYGYKSVDEAAMLPVLQRVEESLKIFPAAKSGLSGARDTLRAYFDAANAGRYADAARLYGGTYEILVAWNPDVAATNHGALFARGCEQNGLQCLRIQRIVSETVDSASEYHFVVEFRNDDGTTFKTIQCCGGTTPRIARVPFTVLKVNGKFLVQELPLYVA
jgi:hypothetical protein